MSLALIMLSFIRRKLSESDSVSGSNTTLANGQAVGTIDNILAQKTSQMSLNNEAIPIGEDALLQELGYKNATDLQETVYDALRTIRDPEKPCTLEDLNVVYEDGIVVQPSTKSNVSVVCLNFFICISMAEWKINLFRQRPT
ncbi:PREDICTED: MIP18 family protein CG30152-like [Rhagoletis zephyria]|uniref:MIP18 family protein CG30152-like n=1 Tax=Rhagoletis zephyria TaxID=28612 RepID=UPI00081156E0|nr:PREDICTED: MIP18 family protein CG30152-like [Rhagoletis zephyria]